MNLFVFSSNRALNDFYINSSDTLLPEAKNIKTFFEDIIIVDDKIKLSKSLRSIILWSIIGNIDIEKIGFDKAFLRFLENSSFLLNFFDELESAMVDIKDIDISDTYGDYEDHLRIINNIYNAYKNELEKRHLYDIGVDFTLHKSYLEYYENIYIFIDGILSIKDFHILKMASSYTNIEIIFEYNKYNSFIFDRILTQKLNVGNKYIFNINKNEIIKETPLLQHNPKISLYSFSMRLNQALLVIAKVNEWLKSGIENIAVILPDESFAKYLKLFDTKRNLNYAMGIEDTYLIKKIESLKSVIEHNPNISRLKNVLLHIEKIDKNCIDDFLALNTFDELFEKLSYDEIIDFILQNIKNLDDVSGGKVKVIGILETRGVEFDKVVIVDFNEEFVPKLSDNDMFLNTSIRKKVSLPTLSDKENLQRHYYYNLINRTKEVCIAFCVDRLHSTLLDDLGLNIDNAINGEDIWRFFPPKINKDYKEEQIIDTYNDCRLSPSSLKSFIDCRRKFYFAKLQKLNIEIIDNNEDSGAFSGNVIHNILRDLGSDFSINHFKELLQKQNLSSIKRLDLEIDRYKLELFLKTQIELLKNNREILYREFPININILGFDFNGRIDRVDKNNKEIFIIDYKLKNNFDIKNEGFLQLLIYKKAIESTYKDSIIKASYYDLYKNKEYFMSDEDEVETQELLESSLNTLKEKDIEFYKTDDKKICEYCDYQYLCNRY
ncbi:hypothetical protein CCY99_06795 [Helicobacter sp. 16-1353]|uniref:RecB family exonuclease n=1 Tax=Helicobacter sp. 16-1353 TaxID=2004996 RepID=UPI000DCC7CA9|nr:PD-(D/E)XK nuclease family protein [Helicobacter sp. 16-1353]RAX53068.1 hypothetical protein CCY99_06795 [Helicobacter sp. 16-1353]